MKWSCCYRRPVQQVVPGFFIPVRLTLDYVLLPVTDTVFLAYQETFYDGKYFITIYKPITFLNYSTSKIVKKKRLMKSRELIFLESQKRWSNSQSVHHPYQFQFLSPNHRPMPLHLLPSYPIRLRVKLSSFSCLRVPYLNSIVYFSSTSVCMK